MTVVQLTAWYSFYSSKEEVYNKELNSGERQTL